MLFCVSILVISYHELLVEQTWTADASAPLVLLCKEALQA